MKNRIVYRFNQRVARIVVLTLASVGLSVATAAPSFAITCNTYSDVDSKTQFCLNFDASVYGASATHTSSAWTYWSAPDGIHNMINVSFRLDDTAQEGRCASAEFVIVDAASNQDGRYPIGKVCGTDEPRQVAMYINPDQYMWGRYSVRLCTERPDGTDRVCKSIWARTVTA